MRWAELTAVPGAAGHEIVLTWRSAGPVVPGARVVRRSGMFPSGPEPATPGAGIVVADTAGGTPAAVEDLGGGRLRVRDTGLAEGMHYYQVFPHTGAPAVYDEEPDNRIAAAAGAPYGFTERLAALLPAVYHRFDIATPAASAHPEVAAAVAPELQALGQLRRFLVLPGSELDRLYGDIASLLDLADVRRVDGRLLPLLAGWIGWRTDFGLDYDRQRIEIAHAPALYRTIGTVPATEAAVRRITGWPVRTKEYVDNIATTNRPERRTLWLATRDGGSWQLGDEPLSIDSSPHGRPVAARAPDGSLTVVYHAAADDQHELRAKRFADGQWQPSEPVVARGLVDRDPAVAQQGATTWLFWSVLDASSGTWRIDLRTRGPVGWGPVQAFSDGPGDTAQRRYPAAAADSDGALWLFWQESAAPAAPWRWRHARYPADPWNPLPGNGFDVPAGSGPEAEADLTVVTRPAQPGDPAPEFRRIGVLWAGRVPVPGQPEQSRWRVAARFKDGSDPAVATDWTPVITLPGADDLRHDREPAAHVTPGGAVQVLFSSTRDGGWSARRSGIGLDPLAWNASQALTGPPFSERAPLPLSLADSGQIDAIVVRSNRSLVRSSSTHAATVTVDRRWSGSTTVRVRDTGALNLRGSYDDHLTYTYETGRTDADRFARDAVGLFLDSGGAPPGDIQDTRERLRQVLPEFMPATDRAVFTIS